MTETVRIVRNLAKNFLQVWSFFIVLNKKQMISVLRTPSSKEKKLLIFKSSSKTLNQNTKAISNEIYLLYFSVISFHSSLWYQLIGSMRNPWVAVNLQRPINYSNETSTFSLTLELCDKPLGILQKVIVNK